VARREAVNHMRAQEFTAGSGGWLGGVFDRRRLRAELLSVPVAARSSSEPPGERV